MLKACIKCGVEKDSSLFYRRLDGLQSSCKECSAKWSKERRARQDFKAIKAVRDRRHYEKHRDQTKAKTRAYAIKHKDQSNACKSAWKARNPEKARAAAAEYRARNRESLSAYNKEFFKKRPDLMTEYYQRRRARKVNAFVETVNPALVYERDMGLCQICGLPVENGDFHLDHSTPLSKGGEHSYANCQTAHSHCNARKSNKMPDACGHLWMRS